MKAKKIFISFLLTIFIISQASAQTTFQRVFGGDSLDLGIGIALTANGGSIFAGITKNFSVGIWNICLNKLDAQGNSEWNVIIGNSIGVYCHSVIETYDGNYIVAGYKYRAGGGNDALLLKVDAQGTLLWSKTINENYNTLFETAYETSDNGLLLIGSTDIRGDPNGDIFLVKTDSNGNIEWTKAYGGGSSDYGFSVIQTTDGGYLLAGFTYSFHGLGNPDEDGYIIKTDSMGNVQWSKTYANSISETFFEAKELPGNNGYILLGQIPNTCDWLTKIDLTGNVIWSESYCGGFGYGLDITTNNGFIIGGGSNYAFLMCTDSNGVMLWTKGYGVIPNTDGRSCKQTPDGGFVLAGSQQYDIYVIKTDSIGNSGCAQTNLNFLLSTPNIITSSVITQDTSGGAFVSFPLNSIFNILPDTTLCLTTGFNELNNNDVEISCYPNPFNENLNIFVENNSESEIILYDIVSRKLLQQKFTNSVSLNTHQLSKGIYLYEVRNKNGKIKNGKIMKE